jgi:hypothetical protein
VADGNFKAFTLSFFWGGVFGFLLAPGAVALISESNPLPIVVALYGVLIAIMMFAIGASFLVGSQSSAISANGTRASMDIWTFMESFGEQWWWRVLPIQDGATFLAWPNVNWDDHEMPL